jgi:uncharacterized membrane protein YkoI
MLGLVAAGVVVVASPAVAQQTTTPSTRTTTTTRTHHARHAAGAMSGQARLRHEARISERRARATALEEAPGRVRSAEIERENGKLIWSFDIAQRGQAGVEEVTVDAMDGSVLSHTHETAARERREHEESKTTTTATTTRTKH